MSKIKEPPASPHFLSVASILVGVGAKTNTFSHPGKDADASKCHAESTLMYFEVMAAFQSKSTLD